MAALPSNDKISCMILSGGLSLRMQVHKALLKFSDRENFLQHIINVYRNAGIQKIIVVKNANISLRQGYTGAEIVGNLFPEKGRLYSIQLGLSAIPDTGYCFLQNIDNPFVTEELIHELYKARMSADYVSPEHDRKGGHPILISKAVINKILRNTRYDIPVNEFLGNFSRRRVAVSDSDCLININSPAEYEMFFKRKVTPQTVL
jgi:molybdenum cofactor cytidylyltransferase